MRYDTVVCSSCKTKIARYELYMNDCYCPFCNKPVDLDENDFDIAGDYYWGRQDLDRSLDLDDESTFFIRFMVDKKTSDYTAIKEGFETLGGMINHLVLEKDGVISKFLATTNGKKLVSGLKLNEEDLEEYSVIATFTFGGEDDEKKILVSSLCHIFPLCIIREEESSYIMANNKGLAKGLVEITNEDEVAQLSLFLTGYEKYKFLCYHLYWSAEYKTVQSGDIFVLWENNSLVSLASLRAVKEVPVEWETYLEGETGVLVSANDKGPGKFISFETMVEDTLADTDLRITQEIEEKNVVKIVSLRGTSEYSVVPPLEGEEEDDDDVKSQQVYI